MSTETISASSNPSLANKLAADAVALAEQEVAAAVPSTEIPSPPDSLVELPGGLLDPFEGLTTTAEIRELTGADEEAISKIPEPGKALLAILERAVVSIGDKKADKETLDSLLAGDREALLLAIRIATFGPEVKVGPSCPECGEDQDFDIDLKKDVKMKMLKEEDREFTVNCKVGKVALSLPTGVTQKTLVNSNNKTAAELDTLLLKGCISSINDMPVVSLQQIRDLSIKDRRELIKAITDRNPGPLLSDITKKCTACESEVSLPLTLADLFRE